MTETVYVFRYPVWTWVCIAASWFGIGHVIVSSFNPITILIFALASLILMIVTYSRMRFRLEAIWAVAHHKGIHPEKAEKLVRFE